MDGLRLFGEFLRMPGSVGAVAPSSSQLAELITEAAGVAQASVVVELGPGTGAVTSAIQRKLRPGATFLAIEANESFVGVLRQRHPGLPVYHDCAQHIRRCLEASGHAQCDCVVSGLPFTAFSGRMQDDLLAAVNGVLAPGGRLVTFAYLGGRLLPGGRRFRRRLLAEFPKVTTTPTVWLNLPPAFVYRAVKSTSR